MIPRIPRERIWPTLVITALGANVVLGITLARIAGSDPSFAVEPGYYAKAIAWDSIQAQHRHNVELGWRVTPMLTAVGAPTAPTLSLQIDTPDGQPVVGAQVSLEAMPVAFASQTISATLDALDAPGRYAGPVAVDRAGLWEFRVTVVRDTERFTADLRLDAATSGMATVVTARPGDPVGVTSGL